MKVIDRLLADLRRTFLEVSGITRFAGTRGEIGSTCALSLMHTRTSELCTKLVHRSRGVIMSSCYMRTFAETHHDKAFMQQTVAQIPGAITSTC